MMANRRRECPVAAYGKLKAMIFEDVITVKDRVGCHAERTDPSAQRDHHQRYFIQQYACEPWSIFLQATSPA